MNPTLPGNDAFVGQQVQKLEAELRRVKQFGIAAVVLVFILLLVVIHDHRKLSTTEVFAKSVTLTDADGNARVRLAVFPEGSGLEAYAPSGERRVQLLGSGEGAVLNLNMPVTAQQDFASVNLLHNNVLLSSFKAGPDGTSLELHSKAANGLVSLGLQGTTASLMLRGSADKVPNIRLTADPTQACTALGGVDDSPAGGSLCLHSPGLPSLELADSMGNRAVVGIPHSADLNADQSSAASLILKHSSGSKVKVQPAPAAQ